MLWLYKNSMWFDNKWLQLHDVVYVSLKGKYMSYLIIPALTKLLAQSLSFRNVLLLVLVHCCDVMNLQFLVSVYSCALVSILLYFLSLASVCADLAGD